MREIVKFLKEQGIKVEERGTYTFAIWTSGPPREFTIENGIISCQRQEKLSLANPKSLEKFGKVASHCSANGYCDRCLIGGPRKDQETTVVEHEYVAWLCGNLPCDKLCGRIGLIFCPLK